MIEQGDIEALAASGITHVRIPVGYWIVDIQPGEPWVSGGWTYLERALGWIKAAGCVVVQQQNACTDTHVAG